MDLIGRVYCNIAGILEKAAPLFLHAKLRTEPLFWHGRLGRYILPELNSRFYRVWFHAASVGEVTGAIPIVEDLRDRRPDIHVFLTVSTPQGFRFAHSNLASRAHILPFPLDFPVALRKAYEMIRPTLYVGLEGEFWPNLFFFLHNFKVPTILLNGRMSKRSARFYSFLAPLFSPIFKQFSSLAMHSEDDREKILRLGAPPDRTLVLGSSKYDALFVRSNASNAERWRKVLGISNTHRVLVGGSLRRSECTDLLNIFSDLKTTAPNLIGIFAPRHLEQIPRMIRWLQNQNIPFELLSEIEKPAVRRRTSVVLVNRMGVLFDLYALGDLIFCGGTFEPVGAHNIMEPTAWGKAVFYGPYIENVSIEHKLLQNHGGSFVAKDPADLLRQWNYWINQLPQLHVHGQKARKALNTLAGVASQQVDLIISALPHNSS